MTKPVNKRTIYFTLAGIIFLAAPLFYMIYWIYCFSVFTNRNDAVDHFKNALPNFMKAGGSTNFIFVLLAIIALIFAAKGIQNKNPLGQKLSMLVTVVSGILAFLYLFQMM